MSTGLECEFFEYRPNEWYYSLQDYSCPVGAWDWREYSTTYGPFSTEEKALKHLDDNHANPGGFSSLAFVNEEISKQFEQQVKEARKR